MQIRSQQELMEKAYLGKYACSCTDAEMTKRQRPEESCPYRTEFQRDRDRILHSNSFRRLKRKTQVFLSPTGDHYRTRLTHTLEVSQIARTISRALMLNEDLTEAIALGHDLGHSPFGHSGEIALNSVCPHGYRHYEQSLRVVDYIEKDGKGLNLTEAVRDGILCHTNRVAATKEGYVVRLADRIAYINHDIEDAVRADILRQEELPKEAVAVLGDTKSKRITTVVASVIENGAENIGMDNEIEKAQNILHEFMFQNVYYNPVAKREETKAQNLLVRLYKHYIENINSLPENYLAIAHLYDEHRAVCDYISGMSDGYATDLYRELFVPKEWK